MPATATALITFEEFEQLPDPPNGHRLELHHGEIVSVPPPLQGHQVIARRLVRQLEPLAGAGELSTEVGFRATLESEWRIADVAFVAGDRWYTTPRDSYLVGAPELVIEILSPSNKASEMLDREQLCLENGCIEFWVVDPKHRQVRVSTRDGLTRTYKSGQSIPLMFGGELAVDPIFE
jgi:Uma2 family endonuclease